MIWYAYLFQNFPQFIVIYTVKGCGIVNKAEIDVFSWTLFIFIEFILFSKLYYLVGGLGVPHQMACRILVPMAPAVTVWGTRELDLTKWISGRREHN